MVRRFLWLCCAWLSFSGAVSAAEACWYPSRAQAGAAVPVESCAVPRGDSVLLSETVRRDLAFGSDGLACVTLSGGHAFHVHPNGRSARTLLFDAGCDHFSAGLTRGLRAGHTVYLDRRLQVVIDPGFEWASSFRYGHAVVCNGPFHWVSWGEQQLRQGGRCGLVDRQGRLVLPADHRLEDTEVFQRFVDAHNHCAPPPVLTDVAALCHARRHIAEVHRASGPWPRHRAVRRDGQWLVGFVAQGRPVQAFELTLEADSAALSGIRRVEPAQVLRLTRKARED